MCLGHEKTPPKRGFPRVSMVGVARIELATPTMSTQRLRANVAEIRGFACATIQNATGTNPVFERGSRNFHARIMAARGAA